MEIFHDAQVIKIVLSPGLFYLKVVKELIMNLPKGFNDDTSSEYKKVHVSVISFPFSLQSLVNIWI